MCAFVVLYATNSEKCKVIDVIININRHHYCSWHFHKYIMRRNLTYSLTEYIEGDITIEAIHYAQEEASDSEEDELMM